MYFQILYVIYPVVVIKKEYQRRVSPIVRKGGRCIEDQKRMMNSRKIDIPNIKSKFDNNLNFVLYTNTEAPIQHIIDGIANQIKYSQFIFYSLFQRLLIIVNLILIELFQHIQYLTKGRKLIQN